MNIVVCVKQVPDTAEMKIDPVTNMTSTLWKLPCS